MRAMGTTAWSGGDNRIAAGFWGRLATFRFPVDIQYLKTEATQQIKGFAIQGTN